VRPILQGTIYKNIDFRLIPDFGGGTTVLQDAYLEFKYFPKATLRAGKFKAPLGLEQLQADQDLAFVERALPTNLVPNRDLGIQLSGDLGKNRLNYAVGVFDGTPDGASVDADSNNRKDLVARLFATPFQTLAIDNPLKGLGVGIAASTGRQDGTLPGFKSPGQVTFFSYGTNVTAAGARTRFSPQAYYYYGPLGLMFEYVRSEQKVKKGTSTPVVSNNALQLAGSYFLTGERKAFKSGSPLREFDPFRGGWGAWELVARFEQLSVDPAAYALGLADPAKSARRARAWAGGVNWYLNRNVRLVLNYENTRFTGGAAGGDRSPEHAVLSRFQIAF
jgi:phosphate-selective porin OprO/OprP